MTNDSLGFSFKVSGIERKQVASVISATIGEQANYAGAPSFNYLAGGWTIDKKGIVTSPEIGFQEEHVTLRMVLDPLKIAGASTEGNLTVSIPMTGHTGNSLRNLANLIWSKQTLIQKALARYEAIIPASLIKIINAVPIDTVEDFAEVVNNAIEAEQITGNSELDIDMADRVLRLSFFNASLDAEEIHAFGVFCQKLSLQAMKQKSTTTRQKENENDKYSFRCYLLKLGFIGEAYKAERKILLENLCGNASYRTIEAQHAAEAKRKGTSSEA